jgi:hypothetical protein
MGVVVQTYIPSYSGSINQEDLSPGQPRHKARTYLKNNQCKKSWGCGSSSRAPAQQVQRPEFKLQYCQKKKKKRNINVPFPFQLPLSINK